MNTSNFGAALRAVFLPALLASALGGCGSANTGSNGTGSVPSFSVSTVASGPVTSLGPLGVAGTRMNDASTLVLLNADAALPSDNLRLGMVADADGSVVPSTSEGLAQTAVAQSVVVGPVTNTDPARASLQVLGLTVRVDRNTLLEGFERVDQLVVGDRVEAYGLRLPNNEGTLATRLVAQRGSVDDTVEVLGTISEIGTATVVTQGLSIQLGEAVVGLAAPSGVSFAPPGVNTLTPGELVRVHGTYDRGSGTVTATSITTGFAPARPDGKWAYVEGFVLAQASATRFQVGALTVDTAEVTTPLPVGQRVRLRGRMESGVLRVNEVAVVDPSTPVVYVVEGPIADFASVASFTVRGERIDASLAVVFDGSPSMLADGRRVRVKGIAGPGHLAATEVTILP